MLAEPLVSNYIIENSPLLIVRIKPDGTTLYANKAACVTSGYGLDEILAQGWLNLNYPQDKREQLKQQWQDKAAAAAAAKAAFDAAAAKLDKKSGSSSVAWEARMRISWMP